MTKLFLFTTILAIMTIACLQSAIMTEEPPPTTPTPASTPTQESPRILPAERTCAIVTAAASLHIRILPDHESAVTGYLFHGETVTVTDDSDPDWWTIRRDNKRGWSRADYLEIVPCP